jgi:hypothetical protein
MRFKNSRTAVKIYPKFVPQMNAAILFPAILTNATQLEDLNHRFPVLGPRLLEVSKSVEGGDDRVTYIWDRMVKFFMDNATTITPDKKEGFLDVSGSSITGCSCKPTCAWIFVSYAVPHTENYKLHGQRLFILWGYKQ